MHLLMLHSVGLIEIRRSTGSPLKQGSCRAENKLRHWLRNVTPDDRLDRNLLPVNQLWKSQQPGIGGETVENLRTGWL